MPAEAIMATANSTRVDYHNAVFEDSPPTTHQPKEDFFESLSVSEKPTHLEYLKNFR